MADKLKYLEREILNKVLNTAETALQVDIVAGAEYAEDSAHTTADTGSFVLGVRNDTLAALGGADGDYVPFQMNASGALYVEVSSSSGDGAIYADDADWSDGSSKHVLVGGLYQSSPQSITDGDVGPLQVNANGNLIVDLSATDNAVLDTIAASLSVLDDWDDSNYANINMNIAGTDVIGGAGAVASGVQRVTLASDDPAVVDLAAIEVLLTGIDSDTDAIKTAVQILDDWDDSNYANVNINLAGSDAPTGGGSESGALRVTIANDSTGVVSVDDGGGALTVDGTVTANLSATDNAVLDTIDAVLDTIKVDTEAVETATEASQAALEKMLYGNALVITAVDGGSTQALGATYESLYVGVGGNVVVTMVGTGNFTFSNVASGQLLPIRITHVINTGTTATNMIALKA